jgi:hypothetical protein
LNQAIRKAIALDGMQGAVPAWRWRQDGSLFGDNEYTDDTSDCKRIAFTITHTVHIPLVSDIGVAKEHLPQLTSDTLSSVSELADIITNQMLVARAMQTSRLEQNRLLRILWASTKARYPLLGNGKHGMLDMCVGVLGHSSGHSWLEGLTTGQSDMYWNNLECDCKQRINREADAIARSSGTTWWVLHRDSRRFVPSLVTCWQSSDHNADLSTTASPLYKSRVKEGHITNQLVVPERFMMLPWSRVCEDDESKRTSGWAPSTFTSYTTVCRSIRVFNGDEGRWVTVSLKDALLSSDIFQDGERGKRLIRDNLKPLLWPAATKPDILMASEIFRGTGTLDMILNQICSSENHMRDFHLYVQKFVAPELADLDLHTFNSASTISHITTQVNQLTNTLNHMFCHEYAMFVSFNTLVPLFPSILYLIQELTVICENSDRNPELIQRLEGLLKQLPDPSNTHEGWLNFFVVVCVQFKEILKHFNIEIPATFKETLDTRVMLEYLKSIITAYVTGLGKIHTQANRSRMLHLLNLVPVRENFLLYLLDNNLVFPLSFVLFRSGCEFITAGALACQSDDTLVETQFHPGSFVSVSPDIPSDTVAISTSVKACVYMENPLPVHAWPNLHVVSYVGGAGTKLHLPGKDRPRPGSGDIQCVAVPYNFYPTSNWTDLCGRVHPDLAAVGCDNSECAYPTSEWYARRNEWKQGAEHQFTYQPSARGVDKRAPSHHMHPPGCYTLHGQAPQLNYNVSTGKFDRCTLGATLLGTHVRPAMYKAHATLDTSIK